MVLDANSLSTNLLVTGLVLVMVFLLPWADRKICGKMGISLTGGVSSNPGADNLLRLRRALLCAAFGAYLLVLLWLVFFSRSSSEDYQVHAALFEDLGQSVRIDADFLAFVRSLFTDGFRAAFSYIRIIRPEDIFQAYMNLMLFVPMGYLLPYISSWVRAKVTVRPAVICFFVSLAVENLQLVTRRGFYDIDDLVCNTLGGIAGQLLYISLAYVVTHPDWQKDLASYRRWRKNARKRTLYPFARRMGLARVTLQAANEEEIWDFYVMKLGFRLKKQVIPLDSDGTDMLLELGRYQIECHCLNRQETLPAQFLTFSCSRLRPIIRRLKKNGIDPGEVLQDGYTGLRCIEFGGPDGVRIRLIEK